MLAITTFSPAGYELYGKKMLESIEKYWPGKIIVYTEKELGISNDKILEQNFFDIEPTKAFYTYLENFQKAHGKTEFGYNYNFDLWKFSRKMFAQWDALRNYEGKAFWLDADIIIKKPIPKQFLKKIFKKKGIVTFFRPGWHSETGFVGFDTKDPKFSDFMNLYVGYLKSGEVFNLKQWHDCAMLDEAVKYSKISTSDLTVKWEQKKTYHWKDLEVFNKSVLDEYITHNKGNRK